MQRGFLYTYSCLDHDFYHYYRTTYNTLLTRTTPKTAINVITATFNSVHDNDTNPTATHHAPIHTNDYYGKYLIHRGFEQSAVLFICNNKYTYIYIYIYIKILNYMTNTPTCFRALHHLQGALILRLLKL